MTPMPRNDDISFVDGDGADKAELADARGQRVDLALGMLASIVRIGLQSLDRNVFDSPRLYGTTELIVDLLNLTNAVRRGSLYVYTVAETLKIIPRLIALPSFYRARTGNLRFGRRRVAKRAIEFRVGWRQLSCFLALKILIQ